MTAEVGEGQIAQELYDRGVYCPGSGLLFFQPDPDDKDDRGICPRCDFSIGLRANKLDDHIVLPELLKEPEEPAFPMPDLSTLPDPGDVQ